MSSQVSEFPSVVDVRWLASHLGEDDLVVGDVRGPNAHTRGHIPGSRPLVLGSPSPSAAAESLQELAQEIDAAQSGHHAVQQDQVDFPPGKHIQGLLAATRHFGDVAGPS